MEILLVSWLSLAGSIASIVLAIVAIILGISARKESRANYESSQKTLAEVDKKAAVMEKAVTENFREILTTLTGTLQKIVDAQTPQKIPPEQQAIFALMAQNPELWGGFIRDAIAEGMKKSQK